MFMIEEIERLMLEKPSSLLVDLSKSTGMVTGENASLSQIQKKSGILRSLVLVLWKKERYGRLSASPTIMSAFLRISRE